MDDVDYVRELYRILTAPPDPEVAPGQLGDDWIDRGDGFGTEVKVTAIDVVPGEHGSQLDIAFLLELPDDLDVPRVGTLLLPLDAQWRELSGYTEPEDYVPRIASQLVGNVRRHLGSYRPSDLEVRELPSRAEQHALLREVLGDQGQVEEQAANRYVVRRLEREDFTVLVTPDQWERVIRRHGPRSAWLLEHFDEMFASTPPEERFLVFWAATSRPRCGRSCRRSRSRCHRYARSGAGWRTRGRAAVTTAGPRFLPGRATEDVSNGMPVAPQVVVCGVWGGAVRGRVGGRTG